MTTAVRAEGWCEVHETSHPNEITQLYTIEKAPTATGRGGSEITMRLCNEVAVALGLTTRDPIVRTSR